MEFKLITISLLTLLLTGCPLEGDNGSTGQKGETGVAGSAGPQGATGAQGVAGINCWDLNGDRVDDIDEDINKDGLWDAYDCAVAASTGQNQTVELNHQHMCEALAGASIYPVGCPSNTHTVPTGTLTRMISTSFFDDGTGNRFLSCGDSPSNGLLSISLRDFVNSDGVTVKEGWFELEGGYIAKSGTMSIFESINGGCQNLCAADADCIASVAVRQSSESSSCRLFYHSDTAIKYERFCGREIPGVYKAEELCLLTLAANAIWSSKCP